MRAADTGNLSPFANFIAKAVDESLTMYLSIFGGFDELLPLKELAKETPYSQEYLSLTLISKKRKKSLNFYKQPLCSAIVANSIVYALTF